MRSANFWLMLISTIRTALSCAILFSALVTGAADTSLFATRSEGAFEKAKERAGKEPTNSAALLSLAQTAFEWAEFARNDDQRSKIAASGINAARQVIEKSSTNAAAHYWLGMNLGQLARTKLLGALKLVSEMEQEFLHARELDEHVDYAGPDRSLGFLYRDAPGWPASIGSKKKAREHLERAVHIHPEFPDNQLALLESFQNWGEKTNFDRQLKLVEKCLDDARKKFTGPPWESSWADWQQRLAEIRSKGPEKVKPVTPKGSK